MTTRTTKEQALGLQNQIEVMYGNKKWFKKIKMSSDDHGYCLEVYLDKAAMLADGCELPHQTNVKLLIINRN